MTAGGYRVSPLEVEAVLRDFPGIDDVAVAEVEIKAQVIVIAAFYTGCIDLDQAALKRFVKSRLARYKQPRLYRHLPALPTGPNNKLQRRKLRDFYMAKI